MNIVQNLLPIGNCRPGSKLYGVIAVVLHWPAAPGQRASETRDYWASPDNKEGSSAHCVIDQDGTIIQCVPWDEKAYHVGSAQVDPASGKIYTDLARNLFGRFASDPENTSPNNCTIGIEMATTDWNGTYTPETVEAAMELCTMLCSSNHINPMSRIIRHIDVVGWKECPKWYIDHPEDLDTFRRTVAARIQALP